MSKRKQHFREFKVKLALKRQGGRLGVVTCPPRLPHS